MASETFEELRGALSKVVESAKDLKAQLKKQLELIELSEGYNGIKKAFSMSAFQDRFIGELNGVVVKLGAEYAYARSEDSNEGRPSWCVQPEVVSKVLDWFEDTFVNIVNELGGLPKETTRKHFRQLRKDLEEVSLIACKLVTAHPHFFAAVVLLMAVSIKVPLGLSLKTILNWIWMGPQGPERGSLAALAQRYFYGPNVPAKSWFSLLQSYAMERSKL